MTDGRRALAPRRISVGPVLFDLLSDRELLDAIDHAIRTRGKLTIVHPNAHHVVLADRDPAFAEVLDRFTFRIPDGIGVHLAARLLHRGHFPSRQTGTDFYPLLLDRANARAWRIFFLGDTDATLEALCRMIALRYPRIAIAGRRNGFMADDEETLRCVGGALPDIVMIGMGAPRQERWAVANGDALACPVTITVGGGLSFLAGTKLRAPRWMQRAGLEWLHRLWREPARLWRRYILGIPLFLIAILSRQAKK